MPHTGSAAGRLFFTTTNHPKGGGTARPPGARRRGPPRARRSRLTRSMRVAMEDLRLDRLRIVCPGNVLAELDGGVQVCGIERLAEIF